MWPSRSHITERNKESFHLFSFHYCCEQFILMLLLLLLLLSILLFLLLLKQENNNKLKHLPSPKHPELFSPKQKITLPIADTFQGIPPPRYSTTHRRQQKSCFTKHPKFRPPRVFGGSVTSCKYRLKVGGFSCSFPKSQ